MPTIKHTLYFATLNNNDLHLLLNFKNTRKNTNINFRH